MPGEQLDQGLDLGIPLRLEPSPEHPLGAEVVPARVEQELATRNHLVLQLRRPAHRFERTQAAASQNACHRLYILLRIPAIHAQRVQLQ